MKKNHFVEAGVLSVVLTSLSYVVGLAAGWIDEINWLEVFAVMTSYASTWLCVRERRFNYVFGAISTAAYAVLFWQWGLLASSLLNAYLAPALVYGWFRWNNDTNTRPVTRLELKWVPVYLAVTALFYLGALGVVTLLDGKLAGPDAVILVGTILAQFLLDNKRIETWFVWMLVNVFAIYTYFNAGLALAGFQYIFFLANTFIGLYFWNKSMNTLKTYKINPYLMKDEVFL